MQCFTCKQTCNREYTKHCTRSRHQLKMAAPAEVSEKRSNFRIRQFKDKCLLNIAANLTLNTMVSFVILLIALTARIACADRHTDTHTRQLYCNPRCTCVPRVNYDTDSGYGLQAHRLKIYSGGSFPEFRDHLACEAHQARGNWGHAPPGNFAIYTF